jgi:hypothetical protein
MVVLTLLGWRLSSAVGVGMGLDCIDYDGASDGCEASAEWNKGPLEPRFAFVLRRWAALIEAAPSNSASPTTAQVEEKHGRPLQCA